MAQNVRGQTVHAGCFGEAFDGPLDSLFFHDFVALADEMELIVEVRPDLQLIQEGFGV